MPGVGIVVHSDYQMVAQVWDCTPGVGMVMMRQDLQSMSNRMHPDACSAQAYPFVVRKILRNDSDGTGGLLQDILYDSDGTIKATRMGALLNAALGYVSEKSDGFVDFDAVPDEGATVQVCVWGGAAVCGWRWVGKSPTVCRLRRCAG